jgi:hypothetical protein
MGALMLGSQVSVCMPGKLPGTCGCYEHGSEVRRCLFCGCGEGCDTTEGGESETLAPHEASDPL